jgi:DNA-directed RNA polymerase subunit F
MDSTKPDIVEEHEVPLYEVKAELARIRKRDDEPNFRVQKTEEYVNTLVTLGPKEGAELSVQLRKLAIPRLSEKHIFKIIDIMPTTADDVKLVLQGYNVTVNADNMKKIASTVKAALE